MTNPLEFTPRCAELMAQTEALISFERWRVSFRFMDVELEEGKIAACRDCLVMVATNATLARVSGVQGQGDTLEQALEDYLHNLAVRLDG